MNLTEKIKELALAQGIDIIRFTCPEPFDYAIKESARRDPHLSLSSAQTVIVCGIYIGGFDMPDREDPSIGQFSRLILSSFYFDVVDPLTKIMDLLKEEGYHSILCDGYSDESSILPLKQCAVRAGIGWQGKNSLIISKEFGSFMALGGIITDANLVFDNVSPEGDLCGKCDACKNACPVHALDNPYKLNTSKCLSNMLEADTLSKETKLAMGNIVLECDLCQLACPWNKKVSSTSVKSNYQWTSNERFGDLNEFFKMTSLIKLSEEDFNKYLGDRLVGTDYRIFRRNLISAMDNSI